MSEWIGAYKRLTPMRTAGSGSARWCIAARGLERFFLKEFLTPVVPAKLDNQLGKLQMKRCERFVGQKQRLYSAISCAIGDTLVPVTDFFEHERRFYAVSELVPESCMTAEVACALSEEDKRKLLFDLSLCLQRLHMQGVVHADLKPDHVLLLKLPTGYQSRLIDLDSGFLASEPPETEGEMEGDPVYLAPEAFLRMVGQEAELGPKLDTFAFGAMIHTIWTGELPAFDHDQYHYLYEAALDGGSITLSDALPKAYHRTVRGMLAADPEARPSDVQVTMLFDRPLAKQAASAPENGLSRFMRKGGMA